MGHLAERNRDVKVIHKLPGRKPKIFLGNARWRQDRATGVSAHGPGEGDPLGVAPAGREILRTVRVVYDTAARRPTV
jgi:hypothetical protein